MGPLRPLIFHFAARRLPYSADLVAIHLRNQREAQIARLIFPMA